MVANPLNVVVNFDEFVRASTSLSTENSLDPSFHLQQPSVDPWVGAEDMRGFRERYITFERLVAEHGTDPVLMTSTLRKRRISPIRDPDDCGVAICAKSRLPGFLVL